MPSVILSFFQSKFHTSTDPFHWFPLSQRVFKSFRQVQFCFIWPLTDSGEKIDENSSSFWNRYETIQFQICLDLHASWGCGESRLLWCGLESVLLPSRCHISIHNHYHHHLVTFSSLDISITYHILKSECQHLVTISSLDVSILSHSSVLMSTSCQILKSWGQHLVTFWSLDVNIFSHSQVLMSTSSRSLSLSSMQTSESSHTCWALKSPLMPEEEKWCAVMNRKYLVHNFTTQRDQESLKFWIGNSLCTYGAL